MLWSERFEALHDRALAMCPGADDFGARDYEEPLRLLLADVDRHACLSPLGGQVLEGSLMGHLAARLRAHASFRRHGDQVATAIVKPLIIIGTMRTGTTALLSLLERDPQFQGLEFWLAGAPMPRPDRQTWADNPLYRTSVQALAQFFQTAPIEGMHPMRAERADECLWAMDQTFWSPSRSCMVTAPDYLSWCLQTDARYAYDYHRRVLALIGGDSPRRWLLKSPIHLWGLDALLEVFPDACVVFTHRDIDSAMASMSSMVYRIRHPLEPGLSPTEIAAQVTSQWGRALDKAERIRRRHDPARFLDVCAHDLQCDPLGTVRNIYQHFGFPLEPATRSLLEEMVARDPRAGHQPHQYASDEFGLTRTGVRAAVGAYVERLEGLGLR